MDKAGSRINRLNDQIGNGVAWAVLVMVLVQVVVVILRYGFGLGSIFLQESILYLHSAVFLLGAGYTLRHDGHVRVDIFYRTASEKTRATTDLLGSLFFLIPVAVLLIWISLPYVIRSWSVLEGSRETSGIPAVFLLKSAIPLFAFLIALQGLSMIGNAVKALRRPNSSH